MAKKPDGIDKDLGLANDDVLSSISQRAEASLNFIPGPPHPDLAVPFDPDDGQTEMRRRAAEAEALEAKKWRERTNPDGQRPNNGAPIGELTKDEHAARQTLGQRSGFRVDGGGNPGELDHTTRLARQRLLPEPLQKPVAPSRPETLVMPTPPREKNLWEKLTRGRKDQYTQTIQSGEPGRDKSR